MSLVGTVFRNIRIVAPLGRGGMGEVYEGIDETLGRRVAVKVMRAERRLDPLSKTRFRREARILSRIEHSSICRVYDFVEQDDVDLLVMERIEGTPLSEAIGRGLDETARRRIAEGIAEALAAAHRLGVIHRDLKPDNVMVTDDAEVKVLDFGLARSGHGGSTVAAPRSGAGPAAVPTEVSTATATVTVAGDLVGTPAFMSPEQARGETTTAASDMYSYGLVLQALATGRPPYERGLSPEVLLKKAMWGDTVPLEGVDRDLARLIGALLSVRPEERPTAGEALRTLHWIRDRPRRRLRRAAVVVVAGSLVVAAVASTLGYLHARRAQLRAERSEEAALEALAEAEAVRGFLTGMLSSADPRRSGRDVRVVEVLDRAESTVDDSFDGQPLQAAAVLDTLGATYHALGELERAEPLLTRAVEIRSDLVGAAHPETLASRHRLGSLLSDAARLEEAEPILRSVYERRAAVLGPGHPDTLRTAVQIGILLRRDRRFEESAEILGRALDRSRSELGDDHPDTLQAMQQLGRVKGALGEPDAVALLESAVTAWKRLRGDTSPEALAAMHSLATLLAWTDHDDRALEVYRAVRDGSVDTLGPDHPATLDAAANLGVALARQGRFDAAESLLRDALERQRRVSGESHPATLQAMRNLAWVCFETGRVAEGTRLMQSRWQVAERDLGPEHRITLETMSGYARTLLDLGRLTEAEALYRRALESRRQLFGPDHPSVDRSLRDLAEVLERQGRTTEAEQLRRERERLRGDAGD